MKRLAPWSLRGRLARRILLATAAIWTLTLSVGLGVMWREMGEVADDALELQARTLAHVVEAAGAIPAGVTSGEFVARVSLLNAPPDPAPWPDPAADGLHSADGWTILQRTTPHGAIVEVGQPIAARREDFIEAARVWLILSGPLLGLQLGIVLLTLRRSLAPVTVFASEMERRRASDLSPAPDAGLPVELLPIPQAVNLYLGRIEALLRSERSFAADAAHELRTPLAVASAQAQLIAEGRDAPQAARAIVGSVARLTSTVERLLELARAEAGSGGSGERSDLVQVLRLLAADAPAERVRFDDGDFEALEVEADADSLALVLGNLLRNAVEHGVGTVRIALRPGPKVEVSHAVPPGAAFLEGRFATGPGSRGTGLGLAIARSTADRFDWGLGLEMHNGIATATVDFGRSDARR